MIKIGIICPSEIAFRRFLPALQKAKDFKFIGVAIASPFEWFGDDLHKTSIDIINNQQQEESSKAKAFIDEYGGRMFQSYEDILRFSDVDAIYIPLPPALHYKWSKLAIENGKHVLIEKPATIDLNDTINLISLAKDKSKVLHENYMFIYHNQLDALNEIVKSGLIGDIRLYRITFGFPRRPLNDFRYNKKLGGGALIDAGGYTIKYASFLLGITSKVICANLNYISEFYVDIYGTATVINEDGLTAQLAFGMDNDYKCDIEIWGSKGSITSNRIMTAPDGFIPTYSLKIQQNIEVRELPADDAFYKSIIHFKDCIENISIREINYEAISNQAKLFTQFKKLAECKNV